MSDNQSRFMGVVNSMMPDDNGTIIFEDVLDQLIEQAASMPIFQDITEDDKAIVRKHLHQAHNIRLNRGTAIVNRNHKKWFEQMKPSLTLQFWNRFEQYLVRDKKFNKKMIKGMDIVTDDVVDLLGNPSSDVVAQRRGLVIGDVQSGKTLNYSGVICKAVDAGYRVIIVLTGTSNDLRKQTQIRLDEAFLGYDSAAFRKGKGSRMVGVGNIDGSISPTAGTTADSDFNKIIARSLAMTLPKQGEDNNPILFVCKKNVSVLTSLSEWMEGFNKHGEEKIDNSLLLIDDESDYASINTNTIDDPTATNKIIKRILNSFRFASYIGFTATPYANIFIDPESNVKMENEDLFPADYIYTLESPSHYIGARDIFGPNAKNDYMIRKLEDAEDYYPFRHKKDWDLHKIAPSLKEAINVFLIANVLRDLDSSYESHRSMMINVSRFVNIQNQLYESVSKLIEEIQSAIKVYSHLPTEDALDNGYIKDLFDAFEKEYSGTQYSWEEIQKNLEQSIVKHPVLVFRANQGNKELDYEKYEGKIRFIVVGGLALSRGLTLEGLMISYIYRRSLAYDTLMQMGRWFGYRNGYSEYCRIYMSEESIAWYQTISDATDELRKEVKRMRERGATPLDFGLKVREDPEVPLLITARNKMKTASSRIIKSSLSGTMVETQALYNNEEKNLKNLDQISSIIGKIKLEKDKKRIASRNIPKKIIVDFLRGIEVAEMNNRFDPKVIADFIKQYSGNELDKWDLYFANGSSEKSYDLSDGYSINLNSRSSSVVRDEKYIRPGNNRLGSPTDMGFGLTEDQLKIVRSSIGKDENISASDFLKREVGKRNPLLVIHLVQPKVEDPEKLKIGDTPAVGFAIGIPYLSDTETKFFHYRVNKIYAAYGEIYENEGEDEETTE